MFVNRALREVPAVVPKIEEMCGCIEEINCWNKGHANLPSYRGEQVP